MNLADEIRKDREAGTPGHFDASDPGDYGDYDGNCVVLLGDDRRRVVVLGGDAEAVADARRFARVPDMEAVLLAAEELADAANKYQSSMRSYINIGSPQNAERSLCDEAHLHAALTAYRKATGAAE